jgi:5'-3' exonuclease
MNKYLDILNNLQEKPPPKADDHILLVDSLNTFIRSFVTLKSMNPGGYHVGGLLGFLRSLGYLTRTLDPTRIICIFDGKGSSMNRKNIDPNYKAQREHLKITNWGMFDTRQEETQSMTDQIDRLMDYLECLPVTILKYDKIEADDIISFIAQDKADQGSRITIVSSDKDFLQIIRPGINIYSPIKRQLQDVHNIQEILGIHPTNYLIAKAIMGDSSDNLAGVKGVGMKSLIKEFPELGTTPGKDLNYVYEICEANLEKRKKLYANIIYEWDKIQRNYELMDIGNPRLTLEEKNAILEDIKHPNTNLHVNPFIRYLENDRIESIANNVEGWLETFRTLTTVKIK